MRYWHMLWIVSIFLVGCTAQPTLEGTAVPSIPATSSPAASPSTESESSVLPPQTAVSPATATPLPQFTAPPLPTPQLPVPTAPPAATNVRSHEDDNYNFRQWATFDGIPPIYEPQFSAADEAPVQDDELVMGVTLGGEAKAYPVTVLQFQGDGKR